VVVAVEVEEVVVVETAVMAEEVAEEPEELRVRFHSSFC
jgi:hypothetical protein